MIWIALLGVARAAPEDGVPPALALPEPTLEDTGLPFEAAPEEALAPEATPEPWVGVPPIAVPRGSRDALTLGAGALVLLGAGAAASRGRASLRESGALPAALGVAAASARALAALFALGALLALVPAGLAGVVPFAVVGAALAVGWSARDALPDLVARGVLAAEGRLKVGTWIHGEGFAGRLESTGLRAAWLVDRRGRRVAVPNRRLLAETVVATLGPHPEVEVHLRLAGVGPTEARAALAEAALLSPWIAPGASPEVSWDPLDPERWIVRMRLVDGRFEDRFAGTLPERVRESLAHPPVS